MNYRLGEYNTPSKKSGKKTYIVKLSRQLTGILIIMLVVMLFKYTKTGVSENVNNFIRENFYKDYSVKAVEVVKKYSPEVKDAMETFVKKVENQ